MFRVNLDRLIARLPPPSGETPARAPCGRPFPEGERTPGVVYCDGRWHYIDEGVLPGQCEVVRQNQARARIAGERRRLAHELGKLSREGFDGFDPARCLGAERAIEVMRRFALDGPAPAFNALLNGPPGLGKTHLLLASHFTLLGRGVASLYVRTPELRRMFRRADSFDEEVANEARAQLERFVYAEAVHFDDVAHIEDDQRARGAFAEGLKDLLDRTRATWATATNRDAGQAESHPDLTAAIVSRLQSDCEIVELDGADHRVESARRI